MSIRAVSNTTERATGRFCLCCGALMMALAIALGAFGAHALKTVLTPAALDTFTTATRYLAFQGVGLLAMAALALQGVVLRVAAIWLTIGVGIFSGSLYILCLTELRWMAWLTPLGGLMMIIGWLLVAWAGFRQVR